MTLTRNRTHSKAYLEALFQQPQQQAPLALSSRPHLQRTPSITGFGAAAAAPSTVDAYKPARSSGLAASSSGTGSNGDADLDLDNDDDLNLDLVLDEGRSLHQGLSSSRPSRNKNQDRDQLQEDNATADEDDEDAVKYPSSEADSTDEPSAHLRITTLDSFSRRSSAAGSEGGWDNKESIKAILALLDDETLDDEERIEAVRTELATKLRAVEGVEVVSALALSYLTPLEVD